MKEKKRDTYELFDVKKKEQFVGEVAAIYKENFGIEALVSIDLVEHDIKIRENDRDCEYCLNHP